MELGHVIRIGAFTTILSVFIATSAQRLSARVDEYCGSLNVGARACESCHFVFGEYNWTNVWKECVWMGFPFYEYGWYEEAGYFSTEGECDDDYEQCLEWRDQGGH